VLQRSIPFERQGRVFGFSQLVENAAAPITAFLMAPLAETTFMPFMTSGKGAD
jgi:DHA3 family multidrug efflux protein-like MFS transporter